MPLSGSHWRSFTLPLSTTTTTSGIVTDVSATFVATTIFRTPGPGILKASRCSAGVSALCSGTNLCLPCLAANCGCACRRSISRPTSPMPGRNTRNAPSRGSDSSTNNNNNSIKS